jgi:hypothetical protein
MKLKQNPITIKKKYDFSSNSTYKKNRLTKLYIMKPNSQSETITIDSKNRNQRNCLI